MVSTITIQHSPGQRTIAWLLVATLITSGIHFVDNAIRLDLDPGPAWFTPAIVLLAWLVMPVLAFAAYRSGSRAALVGYGLLGFAGFAHYLPPHIHAVPMRCLVTIVGEAIASAVFIGYVLVKKLRE